MSKCTCGATSVNSPKHSDWCDDLKATGLEETVECLELVEVEKLFEKVLDNTTTDSGLTHNADMKQYIDNLADTMPELLYGGTQYYTQEWNDTLETFQSRAIDKLKFMSPEWVEREYYPNDKEGDGNE